MKIVYLCDYCGNKEIFDAYYWEADYKDRCSKCKSPLKKEDVINGDVFGYERTPTKKNYGTYDVFGYNHKKKK